jgi:CubicO group peptidase (beta-lactamase class C family)
MHSSLARHRLAALPVALVASTTIGAQSAPADSTIRSWLDLRGRNGYLAAGVVGILDGGRERYVSYGRSDFGTTPLVDADAVFEIGSITKVFTNVLLAEMVLRGEVSLDDPVQKYLPASVKVPTRGGKEITLLDLATASSGLPRLPGNLAPKDITNPYADYSVQQLYDFLSSYTLTRDIGTQYEYSNLGMGLLGHALALRAGKPYETLLIERVLNPLRMNDTRITLTPSMAKRFVTGHDTDMEAVPAWDLPTLAGAGALRSTTRDMLRFGRAVSEARSGKGPLARALLMSMEPRRPASSPTMRIALGWHVRTANNRAITWHNGGTGGFRSFFGHDSASNVVSVVLTNGGDSSDEIGLRILDPASTMRTITPRPVVDVAEGTLERYVGRYAITPQMTIEVTRTGGKLFMQPTAQPRLRIWPKSDTAFEVRVVPVKVTFETDTAGKVTMVIEQGGATMRGTRA